MQQASTPMLITVPEWALEGLTLDIKCSNVEVKDDTSAHTIGRS